MPTTTAPRATLTPLRNCTFQASLAIHKSRASAPAGDKPPQVDSSLSLDRLVRGLLQVTAGSANEEHVAQWIAPSDAAYILLLASRADTDF
ncbi:uncharacterized protein PG986_015115 [Apiospora aurea]|uniref:Uncharacterized protein n=1 Tax=Apiospora aurea TaxID=335848 RepID=A0ABR1PRP7_9PEZI